ncbi:MFS general substrate transporter [Bimuria novae-zelandiae CBS 107.79]|uniref:MFS general substrate transporter n=1 Tax=Bimuria novae-zelandiae CBS 107.79 TaxID=1447943 RepID=A0A6A5VIS0_9PLEO|nr:MFS general substrate transporter [Bimuria novae-zelandiae CBS 107.79]
MARYGGRSAHVQGDTPFPTRQLAILALCRISEPIAFMSIFPYAYYMVQDFNVTEDHGKVSMYVGMITSAFAFMECVSGIFWGRLSDKVGRKKVLLGGLFGTGLSMLLFGFAKSLPVAMFARALGGALNGNIGVLQTTVAELVTVEKHQPRAYSIMPSVWCLGTIVGASLGGVLARPALSLPAVFEGTIFETFPYLLPNLVCTGGVVFGLAVGFLFLEETHEDRKFDQDRGIELGQWLLQKVRRAPAYQPLTDKDEPLDELTAMLENDDASAYRSTDTSPTLCSSRSSLSEPPPLTLEKEFVCTPTIRDAFTKQTCLNIACYGILAFHTISLEQLLPILMSREESTGENRNLPFYFKGGFHLSTQTNGLILGIQGILQMVAQLIIFPWVSKKIGSLRTFSLTIALYPFLYMLAPYLALLPKNLRIPGIVLILVWKVTAQAMSYPCLAIMLANASPSKKLLGTLNGVAMASASVMRGFGPTVSGATDAVGDQIGMSGLAWWTIAAVAMIGWGPCLFMKEPRRKTAGSGLKDEEAALGSDTDSVCTLAPDEEAEERLLK